MTNTQLIPLFAFGLVITGIVFLGVVRAREYERRVAKVRESSAKPES